MKKQQMTSIETKIDIPKDCYFDFFNSKGKQIVCIVWAGNFVCMKCGMRQSVTLDRKNKKFIITEFHNLDCEYVIEKAKI